MSYKDEATSGTSVGFVAGVSTAPGWAWGQDVPGLQLSGQDEWGKLRQGGVCDSGMASLRRADLEAVVRDVRAHAQTPRRTACPRVEASCPSLAICQGLGQLWLMSPSVS